MRSVKTARSLLLAMTYFLLASCSQSGSAPPIINHQSKGNLESNNPIGCIEASDVKSIYTPADLYKGVAACIVAANFKSGALLYALAGVYGRFDTLRVADVSAHQALTVLQMKEIGSLPQGETDKLRQEVASITKDEARLSSLCAEIRKIGLPNYKPNYMTQHGMDAFLPGSASGPVAPFDAPAAWEQSLTSYLHCSAAPTPKG